MKKKLLLGIIITIILAGVSLLTLYYLRTQRQAVQKKAAEEFKTFYFKPDDNSYEAVFSYKWEYPKLIWRFDKLTCDAGKTLGQRRFLHVGQTEGEVQREGWIDQSYIAWNPGEPLPSGEITVPQDRGCWFQLDVTMSIKPQNGQTSEETNAISRAERALIAGCGQVSTPIPTQTPPVITPIPPTATPTRPTVLTATPTRIPSSPTPTLILPTTTPILPRATPTLVLTSTPGPSSTPTPTSVPNATSTPVVPTATSAPGPVSTPNPTATPIQIASQPTPTEVLLPSAGIKLPTLAGILAGLLLISIGLAVVF